MLQQYPWIHNAIVIAVIVLSTVVVDYTVHRIIHQYLVKTKLALPSSTILNTIVRVVIYIIGGLVILQYCGIAIAPLLTAMGIGGLAVALALQDTLSNLFSGLHIVASRNIKQGDFIQIDSGEEGTIVDITWRNTMLKNVSNNLVIIPNAKLATAVVTNFNAKKKEIVCRVNIRVVYGSDLEKVEKITKETIERVLEVLEVKGTGESTLYFKEFAESGILLLVTIRAKASADRFQLQHEFIKALHARFEKEHIRIPHTIIH